MSKNLRFSTFSLLLLLCLNIHCSPEGKPKVYVIAFLNTLATNESKQVIGKGFEVTEKQLRDLVGDIGKTYPIDATFLVYKGHDFTSAQLRHCLGNLPKLNKNDVLICCIGAHGSAYEGDTRAFREYPNLHFEADKKLINSMEMHQILKTKGAGLVITLIEACSANMGRQKIETLHKYGVKAEGQYAKLFLNLKGDIIMAATKPDTYACLHNEYGGMFSTNLFDAIKNESTAKNPTWQHIAQVTQAEMTKLIGNNEGAKAVCNGQQIIYQLNIK
jgi:hypothetical protein